MEPVGRKSRRPRKTLTPLVAGPTKKIGGGARLAAHYFWHLPPEFELEIRRLLLTLSLT